MRDLLKVMLEKTPLCNIPRTMKNPFPQCGLQVLRIIRTNTVNHNFVLSIWRPTCLLVDGPAACISNVIFILKDEIDVVVESRCLVGIVTGLREFSDLGLQVDRWSSSILGNRQCENKLWSPFFSYRKHGQRGIRGPTHAVGPVRISSQNSVINGQFAKDLEGEPN